MNATESIGTTEMVSRVVLQARRSARAGSELDEQAWFDAGEPDTVPNVPLQEPEIASPAPRSATWLMWLAAAALTVVGYAVGFHLGSG